MLALIKTFILCYVTLNSFSRSSAQDVDGDLLAVSVIYRHGERTPTTFYPNDPYKDPSFWPDAPGELTNDGKRRHHNLGKWLRQRYDGFLSSNYSASDIYVRAGDINRCLESAASNLCGLYPPQGDQIWDPSIQWQPIPIHTVLAELDGVIELAKPCPKKDLLVKQILSSGYYKELDDVNRGLYQVLSKYTGENIESFGRAGSLYDTLAVESLSNFSLPAWTNDVFPEPLRTLQLHSFAFSTSTSESSKFAVGQLFDKILRQFEYFVSGSGSSGANRKLMVYSGHDTNVFNVLNALGTPNMKLIPYAGAVLFELRKRNNKYHVTMFYKTDNVTVLSMNDCESNCAYNDFTKIFKSLAISDDQWDDACKVSLLDKVADIVGSIL